MNSEGTNYEEEGGEERHRKKKNRKKGRQKHVGLRSAKTIRYLGQDDVRKKYQKESDCASQRRGTEDAIPKTHESGTIVHI